MNNVLLSQIIFIALPILWICYSCFVKVKSEKLKKAKIHQIACVSLFIIGTVVIVAIKITGFDTVTGEVKDYKTNLGLYTGILEKGIMTGSGTLILEDETVIKANFEDNKATGYGVIQFSNSNIYEGEIADGKMNGEGVYTVENQGIKTIYKGYFKNSFLTGLGVINYPDGTSYEGYCVNFKPNTLTYGNKTALSQDEMIANGYYAKMTFSDGSVYVGEFKNGNFYGNGKFICKTCGHVYEGEFENNMMNGIGKLTKSDGQMLNGSWINDCYNNKLFSCDGPFYQHNKQLNGGINEDEKTFKK